MKKLATYLNSGILILFVILAISCSKEEANKINPNNHKSTTTAMDKSFANGIHGNEFVSGQLNSVMTHYNGMTNFANNTGNNNFTGSGPGSGGGGNGNSGSGSFTVFNTTYPIDFGGFESWGDGWFSIYLIDVDADFSNSVIFDILSPSESEIAPGTYYYSEENTPFTFNWSHVFLNNEDSYEINDGTISISHSGNSYSIIFNGTLAIGGSITGSYSGSLVNLGEEPEPTSSMSATIGSQAWVAENVFANLDSQYGFLTITGSRNDGSSISMELNQAMIYQGAQLTLSNDGVYFVNYYTVNGSYYADSYASVYITTYTSSSISGTFEFNGLDYNNNPLLVTNGVFTNVSIN